MTADLDQRKKEILRAIVEDYISKGEPVGSQQLARRSEVEVSAATIRAVMADLEELGYLEKPHTSAGRVPTDRGYRFFVDTLVQVRAPNPREREAIDHTMPHTSSVEAALDQASHLLHDLSHHASVVVIPRPEETPVKRVEFVRLREDRALAVLVNQSGIVQNKLLRLDSPMSQDELTQASNYLNALLSELTLEAARERIAKEMADQAALYDKLTERALTLAQALMADDNPASESSRMLVFGHASLLQDLSEDVQQAQAALRLLEERKRLLQVLDQTRDARQMQIFIGSESGFSNEGVSLVASPYGEGDVLGTLGVIGPTRMNYSKIISLVDYTARALSKLLSP
jgi:heat-inducible transcriptional repressor